MVERIKQIIEYYGINTRQFEQKIFASSGQIYKYLSRGSGLNSDTLVKILENCREISPDWLLLGKGEMLRENFQKTQTETHLQETQSEGAIVAYLEKKVSDLQNDLAAANRTIGELQYRISQEKEKNNSASARITSEPMSV